MWVNLWGSSTRSWQIFPHWTFLRSLERTRQEFAVAASRVISSRNVRNSFLMCRLCSSRKLCCCVRSVSVLICHSSKGGFSVASRQIGQVSFISFLSSSQSCMQSKQKVCTQGRETGLEKSSRQTGQVASSLRLAGMISRSLLSGKLSLNGPLLAPGNDLALFFNNEDVPKPNTKIK